MDTRDFFRSDGFVFSGKSLYLPPNWFRLSKYSDRGLKGNRVEIPDSPAAVKLHFKLPEDCYSTTGAMPAPGRFQEGSQSEDLPSFIDSSVPRG